MTQTEPIPSFSPRPAGRGRARSGLWVLVGLLIVVLTLGFGVLALSGKTVRLPVWMVAEAEAQLNGALGKADVAVSIGAIEVAVDADWVPRLRLEDLRLLRPNGAALLTLPDTRVAFDPVALAEGTLRPETLRLIGARMAVHRDAAGNFDLGVGGGLSRNMEFSSLSTVVAAANAAFGLPALASLTRIEAEGLTLTLTDDRARRTWEVGDGRLTVENSAGRLSAELGLSLVGGGAAPAQATLTLVSEPDSAGARLAARFDQVAAADIAVQAAPLAWLGVLDAPISGRIAARLDGAGDLAGLEGELTIGAGDLRPTAETRPIPFDGVALRLAYDPVAQRIALSELSVRGKSLRLQAVGQSYLEGGAEGALPTAFTTQIQFNQVKIDPEGLFQEPLKFSNGALDLRLRLNPFRVEIGQLALVQGSRHLAAKGQIEATPEGWSVAVDLGLDQIKHDGLLALWPLNLIPSTRAFLRDNVQEGKLFNVKAALRLLPGKKPRLSLSYDFANADVIFLKTMPPILSGYGYSTIEDETYTMVLSQGHVTAPLGGDLNVAGSVFAVKDLTAVPTHATIRLKSDSTMTAALSLLDQPPFGFISKAGQRVDLGQGHAVLDTLISLPLVPQVKPSDLDYHVTGTVSEVTSDVIVPGKVLTAPSLALVASPAGIQIAGQGLLGKVPFDVTYWQGFGPADKGKSAIEGTVTLSQAAVAEFGLGLPEGMVSGSGTGEVSIDLVRGQPAQLQLSSDLAGIGLTLPELGWTLPKTARGILQVAAELGSPAKVNRIYLRGGGLEATGSVTLRPKGGLDVAAFDRVQLNGWLDAAVALRGRGAGKSVAIEVTSGRLDLQTMTLGGGKRSGSGSDSSPISVALDKLNVSEGITLTRFRGDFNGRGGFNGDFTAQVNGKTAIAGAVVPSAKGTAVRIQSQDAGAVMAAAGVFPNARGGTMDLTLTPRGPSGYYDGRIGVTGFRIRNNSVMTELLSAISVVGLLEMMDGEGIAFNTAQGEFTLTPDAVEMRRGSAVGVSLGISMAGVYHTEGRRLDLQGVVSPIYLLNGIGALLTRRGEGLFGFNYSLRGTADNPKVRVNPLSILTPGMFRDIFRQAPPVLPKEAG